MTEYWTWPRRHFAAVVVWFWLLGVVFGLATGYLIWN